MPYLGIHTGIRASAGHQVLLQAHGTYCCHQAVLHVEGTQGADLSVTTSVTSGRHTGRSLGTIVLLAFPETVRS